MAEEVAIEVEAVQAVYGEDCLVLDQFPPHLHVHIKPRTADVSSQQFVEAVLGIQAGSKEAVERLSTMNHPDGNCPLCLYPLFPEHKQNNILPFMKLMSCFHCFHSECIIRWWNWLQTQQEMDPDNSSSAIVQPSNEIEQQQGMHGMTEGSTGNCPVCRKVFHAKDIEHVLSLVGSHSLNLSSNGTEITDDEKLLHSDSEVTRRLKFEAMLKLQEENNGLIEPKKNGVIVPGMFLQRPITPPSALSAKGPTSEQQQRDPIIFSETSSSGSSSRASSTSEQRNLGMRRHRVRNSRKPVKQWVKKDNTPTN
ncbi:hypothetical protein PVL29_019771 [Vitis rotundifolia]|uniref:RING-type domain-containing protein n=1 Tax=Vitis rotundifolia TaxID=103349 RepID=A0AA38Z1N0_VITRO|nr:hypothetical protein PVL29_019771 [Vitis rotundifolia]